MDRNERSHPSFDMDGLKASANPTTIFFANYVLAVPQSNTDQITAP